jgi:hypothetical protein
VRIKEITFIAICFSGAAHAGPYGDDMARCLVDSTTKDDRIALVRWMFAAAAANPAVAPIAKVSPQTMDDANSSMGFQVLGQVAAGELFSSPEVKKAISGLQGHIDTKKLEELKGQ